MDEDRNDPLALLAHELRTPVSTIVAAASGLERGGDSLPPDKRRALVRMISREAARLGRMVEDVVAASKLEAGALPVELDDVDVSALTRAAVEAASTAAPAGRTVSHAAGAAVRARADADRLRQVLDNLIDNAVKHAEGAVSVSAARRGEIVRIEVSDDGVGIPVAERQAIFEKFHRLDSPASGSGLGLWLCRELVTRMDGAIEVDDAPGGGSRFSIELPPAS